MVRTLTNVGFQDGYLGVRMGILVYVSYESFWLSVHFPVDSEKQGCYSKMAEGVDLPNQTHVDLPNQTHIEGKRSWLLFQKQKSPLS